MEVDVNRTEPLVVDDPVVRWVFGPPELDVDLAFESKQAIRDASQGVGHRIDLLSAEASFPRPRRPELRPTCSRATGVLENALASRDVDRHLIATQDQQRGAIKDGVVGAVIVDVEVTDEKTSAPLLHSARE